MELKEKIKILSQQRAFGINKLTKVGDSYFLRIPRNWIHMHCAEIDGDYYFRLEVDGGTLKFSSIELDDVEAVTIKEKQGDRGR